MQVTSSSASTAVCLRRNAALGASCSKQTRSQLPQRQRRSWQQQQQQRKGTVPAAAAEEQGLSSADPSQQPSTSYSSSSGAEEVDESREFALAMAKIAWETKAEDILCLHVAPLVYWTRYFLIATVFSRPQLNALLGKMSKEAAEVHDRRLSINPQNSAGGGWELLDYGDVVIHILTAEQRDFYDLEGMYGAAEEVPLPFDTQADAAGSAASSWTKKL